MIIPILLGLSFISLGLALMMLQGLLELEGQPLLDKLARVVWFCGFLVLAMGLFIGSLR